MKDFLINFRQNHGLAFELILFVLACLVSICSPLILAFLKSLPHRQKNADFRATATRIQLLKRLKDNPYQLILYIAGSIFESVKVAAGWALFIVFVGQFSHPIASGTSIWSLIGGYLIGAAVRIDLVLKQLADYDRSIATLQRRALKHVTEEQLKSLQTAK